MKISPFFSLAFLAIFATTAAAQNAPQMPDDEGAASATSAPNGAAGASRVVPIEENSLATLPDVLAKTGGSGAISLSVSEAAFGADARAREALISWVRGGGTVFLHTGAARAFGFQTVAARLGTNALAGQLYGRARGALPFGAHPLLWDDGKNSMGAMRRAPGADPTLFPGVNVVFYEMREGDHLVQSHPAGTPLLEVSDLVSGARAPLYAAALAPFGRGFAVFTPDFIDQKRGDGALFARNLLALLGSSSGSGAAGAQLIGVPTSAIENGASAPAALQKALLTAGARATSSPALPAFGTAPANAAPPRTPRGQAPLTPPMDGPEPQNGADNGDNRINGAAPVNGATRPEARAEAVVLLSRSEASSYANLIAAGGDRAGAAINLLRARLFLGRDEAQNAARALEASANFAPDSAEITLWRGILQVAAAQNLNQPSPTRAALVQGGARDLLRAANGASLLAAGAGAGTGAQGTGNANAGGAATRNTSGGATLAGIPLAALRNWGAKLERIAQVFALEPPFVEQYGTGDGAITVRAVANDASLRLIVPGARALAGARDFGWHGDREEILLFPTAQTYAAYRRALGLNAPTLPLPAGAVGDVVGQRISMLALPSTPALRRNPATGQVTVLATRNGAANALARLHSYVLLGAYDEGARSPVWLQLGLESLINTAIVGSAQDIGNNQTLEQTVQVGGLLTPEQFRPGLSNARPEQLRIAQTQAAALMAFFYRTYGVGAVTETVQRLGTGQNIDEALQATTQGNQLALFQNWRDAQFGPRNFPNRGLR